MKALSSTSVLVRTRAGQAVVQGSESLPPPQVHLLMRLNGYTSLGELVCESEAAELLPLAQALVDGGLAKKCKHVHEPLESSWGELLGSASA